MKVVIPNTLTVQACSVTESDAADGAVWSASTAYAQGQKVRHQHYSYESLADNNKGNNPAESCSGIGARWKPLGATLPWRMIDDKVETQTVGAAGQPLTFTVPFNRATAFGLLNLAGAQAEVVITDSAEGVVFEQSYNLIRDIGDFSLWEYNYSYIEQDSSLVVSGIIPMPITGTLSVTLTPGAAEAPAVGAVVAGREHYVGATLWGGAEVGELDYSRKDTDEFGTTTFVRRSYASELSLELYVHPDREAAVHKLMRDVRALPCLWLGDNQDNGAQSLLLYGWKEDFRMSFEGPGNCALSLDLQGLI